MTAMTEFFPPQPNLYTVEAHGRPVVTLSATPIPTPSDDMLTNPLFVEALRKSHQILSDLRDDAEPEGVSLDDITDRIEIDEALETHLGEDLQIMEDVARPGQPLWDGDRANINVRRATNEETEIWRGSLLKAMKAGEQEPGDTDWLVFLTAVREID